MHPTPPAKNSLCSKAINENVVHYTIPCSLTDHLTWRIFLRNWVWENLHLFHKWGGVLPFGHYCWKTPGFWSVWPLSSCYGSTSSFPQSGFLSCVALRLLHSSDKCSELRGKMCRENIKIAPLGSKFFYSWNGRLSSLHPQHLPSKVWCPNHNTIPYYWQRNAGKSKQRKKAVLILI